MLVVGDCLRWLRLDVLRRGLVYVVLRAWDVVGVAGQW